MSFLFSGCRHDNVGHSDPPKAETVDVCLDAETPLPDTSEAEKVIEESFGAVERDSKGRIIGVDLAKARASATDLVLRQALTIPGLKKFRLAGGGISSEVFVELQKQNDIEDLYLQGLAIQNEDLVPVISALKKLKRLTLRSLFSVTDEGVRAIAASSGLTKLDLIEMNISGACLETIIQSKTVRAIDLRQCGLLNASHYRSLQAMDRLVDLKVGGLAVNDDVLDAILPLSALTGLAIEDALISADGLARFLSESASRTSLETLVLNRNSAILDGGLLPVGTLPKLKRLTVSDMMIVGSFLEQMAVDEQRRPKLHRLSLRKSLLTPENAKALRHYPELRQLDLSCVAMTPELAEVVTSLDWLEELDARDCQLDEQLIETLRSIKSLKKLLH